MAPAASLRPLQALSLSCLRENLPAYPVLISMKIIGADCMADPNGPQSVVL